MEREKLVVCGILTLVMLQVPSAVSGPTNTAVNTVFFERLTIVEYESGTFKDDFTYLAAIPASIYYEGGTQFVSSLVFDQASKNEKYLIEDIAKAWGPDTEIICIGDVNNKILNDFKSNSQTTDIKNIESDQDTLFGWAAEIAEYFWDESTRVVIAPVLTDGQDYVEYIQTASNGAIIASIFNCPLLYANTEIPQVIVDCLINLGVEEVILVQPSVFESNSIRQQLADIDVNILDELATTTDIIQYIKFLGNTNYLTLIYNNEEDRNEPYPINKNNQNSIEKITSRASSFELFQKIKSIIEKILSRNTLEKFIGGHEFLTQTDKNANLLPISTLVGPIGDIDEMPFGPAAFMGAFHAGPLIAFPTKNVHCQKADDYAEGVGDYLYEKYKEGESGENAPVYEDMEKISREFYLWLNDIGADATSQETVIFVGNLAEIDPSLDRSIFGKAISGRIASAEGPDAACIVNRNVLYPEIIKINQGNDVLMSFIAYGYGCKFTDNKENTQEIWESTVVPEAFENAGCNVKYHVTFDTMTNALKSGVRYWVNSGHANYGDFLNPNPVTGRGIIGYFKDNGDPYRAYEPGGTPENPDTYKGPNHKPYEPDGYVFNCSDKKCLAFKNTDQWVARTGNLHSAAMYFLLCNLGCECPVIWQRSGASVVIACMVSVSFEGGGCFDIRLNQEIAEGETFGNAVLTALREAGSIYSENKQGEDESLFYIIYGDPSLKLAT